MIDARAHGAAKEDIAVIRPRANEALIALRPREAADTTHPSREEPSWIVPPGSRRDSRRTRHDDAARRAVRRPIREHDRDQEAMRGADR